MVVNVGPIILVHDVKYSSKYWHCVTKYPEPWGLTSLPYQQKQPYNYIIKLEDNKVRFVEHLLI